MTDQINLRPGEKEVCVLINEDHPYLLVCYGCDAQLTHDDAIEYGRSLGYSLPTRTESRKIYACDYLHYNRRYWIDSVDKNTSLAIDGDENFAKKLKKEDLAYTFFVRRIPIINED